MVAFIDDHFQMYGVEPIRGVVPIAPSTYFEYKAREADPTRLSARAQHLVDRDFTVTRPNRLWVSDLTYVVTWRCFVCVALVIDAFAQRIVGWRAAGSGTARRRTATCRWRSWAVSPPDP